MLPLPRRIRPAPAVPLAESCEARRLDEPPGELGADAGCQLAGWLDLAKDLIRWG